MDKVYGMEHVIIETKSVNSALHRKFFRVLSVTRVHICLSQTCRMTYTKGFATDIMITSPILLPMRVY